MRAKHVSDQRLATRTPQQGRAQEKVWLILEAAVRLIERGGFEQLTTNAIAETAGVSIGTLYQYFRNKDSILDAVIDREMKEVYARILKTMAEPPSAPGDRVGKVLRAALSAYDGRRRAHRLLLERALSRASPSRLHPLFERLIALFATQGIAPPGVKSSPMSPADAFVLTHAVAGVVRALVATEATPGRTEGVEQALSRLVLEFVRTAAGGTADAIAPKP